MNASIIRRAARLEVLEREDGRNITKEEKRKNLLPIFIMRHDHLRPLLLSGLLRSIDDGGVSRLEKWRYQLPSEKTAIDDVMDMLCLFSCRLKKLDL